ncbi:MAG: trypsin-like peptidase domain-containing protein [Acidimicrobiia bacterium]|nr:trypsin-like peptidase domain-containing protein [Acidimicrobiia bacterium]
MGDSIPGNDENTAEEVTNGDLGRPESPLNRAPDSQEPVARRVSEPPPPPLLPGQAGYGGPADDDPGQPAGFSDWLLDWGGEATPTVEGARETRELPAVDPHEPPAATAPIEGLQRTADTGDDTPTIEPDWSGFTELPVPPRQAHETTEPPRAEPSSGSVPSPPPVRTPPVSEPAIGRLVASQSEPPAWDEPVAAVPTEDVPIVDIDTPSQPEVTELDIARLARTTTTRTIKIGAVDVTFGSRRSLAAVGAFAMTLLITLVALVVSGGGDDGSSRAALEANGDSRQADFFDEDAGLLASGMPASPNISEIARSTVRVVGLDAGNQALCVGSGVIVDAVGIILTNSHVVSRTEDCDFETIGIAVTEDTSKAPELLYQAELLVKDDVVDLAVLHVVGPLPSAPDAPFPRSFPAAVLGDSDAVELGDNLRILGYPVIGGDTITSTTGSVSGFSSQEGIGDRALIKTDAAISAGNSGGSALNDAGEMIGIPTRARATESGPPIDCRAVNDTNQDGSVDEDDNCIPVGGFLNGIRPVNLASDLLAEARAVRQAARQVQSDQHRFDLSGVVFGNPRFSVGQEGDRPADEVLAATVGVEDVCLFVDWTGIPDGVPWSVVWLVDGEQVDAFGRLDQVWDFGETGRNFWYCAEDGDGHLAGVYEIGLFLDDQLMFVESIQVLEDDPEIYEVTWVNQSDQDICGLAINPLTESRHAGLDELDAETVIGVGQAYSMELPAGVIVAEAFDCSGRAIAVELDGIRIPDDLFVDDEEVPLVIGAADDGR